MIDYRIVVVSIFAAFVVAELIAGRFLFRAQTTRKDIILELGAGIGLPVLVVPLTLAGSAGLAKLVAPDSAGSLSHWPVWLMVVVLLLADDLTQYAWHRLSHSWPKLYLLHRAHHSAEYLSVRVVYRNNLIYYALMPGLWLSGLLLHLGFGSVYYGYFIAKMAVIIAAHSSVAWDAKLGSVRWLRPLRWVLIRLISTPTTHSAHHGKHEADGVTHYKGNYGNFLFLWDVLFGTAKISERRPTEFGLENVAPATWQQELLWPVPSETPAQLERGDERA